jgi:hypothetical protein
MTESEERLFPENSYNGDLFICEIFQDWGWRLA